MTNPEQPVLDVIAELVDWQLEEGRRGDGPAGVVDPAALRPEWLDGPSWRDMATMPGFTPQAHGLARGDSSSAPGIDTIDPANGEQSRIAGGS